MNVATLKEMCKEHGLKVSGKKQELIDRLLEATASDDDIFLLEEEDDVDVIYEAEIEEEAFEPSIIEEVEDEILDAEVFEAELFEDDEEDFFQESEPKAVRKTRLQGESIFSSLSKPNVIATLLVVLIIAGGGYWYWSSHLDPFVSKPIEYGDQMEFTISSGTFEVEGEEMIREIDNRLNGALAEICEKINVEFYGTGDISVKKGTSSELLDSSDTKLLGTVQAKDAYGLTFLSVEQELTHQLTANIESKTWFGDSSEGHCSVEGSVPGYSLSQTSKSWTEIGSKALLSTDSSLTLEDPQGGQTSINAVSFGVPDDSLSDIMPELLLPLKPVELTPLFGNSLLEEGSSGTSGYWDWVVSGSVSVDGVKGLQINMQHTEIEDCIGRANMVLYVVPSSPWAVEQRVDINLEKSRYDSSGCGVFAEYLIDQTLPEGSISIQYTLVKSSINEGDGMINWLEGYNHRPASNSGAISANQNWGNSGTHMPDLSESRDWTLDDAVACIINKTVEANDAAISLASGGYVFKATDDRSNGNTQWNVSWVDDNNAGWVIVESRTENCSVLSLDSLNEADSPAHRRESIPKSATIKEIEDRIIDSERYPSLVSDITSNGKLTSDTTIGYFLTVPPEANDLLDLIDGYQDGTIGVTGQREWTENGLDHSLNYAIDGTNGRMVGWIKTSSNS